MLASLHPPGVYSHFFLPKAPDPVPGALPGSQWVPGAAQIPGKGSPGAQGGPGAAVYSLQSPRGQVLAAPKQHKILGKIPMQLQRHLPAWAWQELLLIPKSHLEGGKPGGVFGSLDVQIQVPGSVSHLGMALPKQIPAFNCSCGGSGGIFGILHVQIQVRGSMSPLGMALPKPNSTLQPSLGCSGRIFGMLDVQIRVAGSVSPLPAGHPGMWFGISGAGMWPRSSPTIQVWFLG